ncbi:MAG: DUF4097 family beta strand repeat protein [Candidatus Tectomicrobia bacterium]|nr:DUF4097 family beta strand repeat protein [Candidatus Tectomicrobia bacterium]
MSEAQFLEGLFDQFFRKSEDDGEEVEKIEATIPFSDVNSVILKNINGAIRISKWDKEELSVKAIKKVKFKDAEKGREYAKEVNVSIGKVGDRIEVITQHPKGSTPNYIKGVSVDYTIRMPQRAAINASNVNGSVSISGTHGPLKVSTSNGSVILDAVHGNVSAKTTNGSITAKLSKLEERGEFETVNGSIEVSTSDARSVPINAQTVNGSISLKISSTFAANLDVNVTSGSITCDFPMTVQGKLDRHSLAGKINGGGVEVKLETVNGNITLLRCDEKEP